VAPVSAASLGGEDAPRPRQVKLTLEINLLTSCLRPGSNAAARLNSRKLSVVYFSPARGAARHQNEPAVLAISSLDAKLDSVPGRVASPRARARAKDASYVCAWIDAEWRGRLPTAL